MDLKLKKVTRIDSIPAGSTYFNEQGFLHDTPIVTSTGVFEYGLPDGGMRRELRLPEYVFDKESLASYTGKPVIITHEAGNIDKDNVMDEIVGTIISDGCEDGNNVRCKIVIHNIDKVRNTPYRELSLGYNLDLIEEPGEWNGEPYDAIQTNIRINHLAIVNNARAGEQAHLNLDGKKIKSDDKKHPKGGNESMQQKEPHGDSIDMTPEELIEAIKSYKASQPGSPDEVGEKDSQPEEGNTITEEKGTEPLAQQPDAPDFSAQSEQETEKNDGNLHSLISVVEKLLAAIKEGNGGNNNPSGIETDEADGAGTPACEEENGDNSDSSEDLSQSMNNDSVDDTFHQRLSICRIGDMLRMDGLENKSILDGKKAIVSKVLPTMRLDGKGSAYIDVAYDLAVGEVNKRKNVAYQKNQMTAASAKRADGKDNESMASTARQRMLEREGGNE